jgi:hypothetical protein
VRRTIEDDTDYGFNASELNPNPPQN